MVLEGGREVGRWLWFARPSSAAAGGQMAMSHQWRRKGGLQKAVMEWWVEPNWGLTMAGRRHLLRPAGSGGRACGLFVLVIVLLFLENNV